MVSAVSKKKKKIVHSDSTKTEIEMRLVEKFLINIKKYTFSLVFCVYQKDKAESKTRVLVKLELDALFFFSFFSFFFWFDLFLQR